jgi:hypothetical protein
MSHKYILIPLFLSKKGWHGRWLYPRDVGQGPFLGLQLLGVVQSVSSEAPSNWSCDVAPEEKARVQNHLAGVLILQKKGVIGVGVIGAYLW